MESIQATTGVSDDPNKSVSPAINRRMSHAVSRLAVIAAALLFSTGGAAIKVDAFSAAQVSCVRSGLAALVLLIWARGRVEWSLRVFGIGAAYASVLTLFVLAIAAVCVRNSYSGTAHASVQLGFSNVVNALLQPVGAFPVPAIPRRTGQHEHALDAAAQQQLDHRRVQVPRAIDRIRNPACRAQLGGKSCSAVIAADDDNLAWPSIRRRQKIADARELIAFHLESLREEGEPIPEELAAPRLEVVEV